MNCADRASGHRQGPHILAPGPGSGGGNRPPRRQAHPGAPSLPRGAPKGRHNCQFQPAAGKSEMGRNVFPSHGRNSQYGPRGAAARRAQQYLARYELVPSTGIRYGYCTGRQQAGSQPGAAAQATSQVPPAAGAATACGFVCLHCSPLRYVLAPVRHHRRTYSGPPTMCSLARR
jgi:hypothetical protein